MHPLKWRHVFSKLGTCTSLGLAGTIMVRFLDETSPVLISDLVRMVGMGVLCSGGVIAGSDCPCCSVCAA